MLILNRPTSSRIPPPMPFAMFEDLGKYLLIAFVVFLGCWRGAPGRFGRPVRNGLYVEGEMLSTRVLRKTKPVAIGVSTHEWYTEVHYRYTVDGQSHTGNRLRAFGLHHFHGIKPRPNSPFRLAVA